MVARKEIDMTPIIRIALRYGTGWAVGWGLADQISNDPDVIQSIEIAFGVGVPVIVEGWYWMARMCGKAT